MYIYRKVELGYENKVFLAEIIDFFNCVYKRVLENNGSNISINKYIIKSNYISDIMNSNFILEFKERHNNNELYSYSDSFDVYDDKISLSHEFKKDIYDFRLKELMEYYEYFSKDEIEQIMNIIDEYLVTSKNVKKCAVIEVGNIDSINPIEVCSLASALTTEAIWLRHINLLITTYY